MAKSDDNKRTGKVPASVYAEAHTPETLEDIRQKFGRKVKMPNGGELRSTWYQPPALTSEPTNDMTKGAFEDHLRHAKRYPPKTMEELRANRKGDSTLNAYLKELGREPTSLKSADWGAADRGRHYTTAELDMIRSAEGRRVVMPNGHVLQTTWYSNPSTAGLTEWEKKQIAKAEQEYVRQQGEKVARRQAEEARARYGNPSPAAVAPATPAAPARPALVSRIEAMKKPELLKAARELNLVKADGKPFTMKSSVDLMRRYLAHEHRRYSTAGVVGDEAVHAVLDKMSGKSKTAPLAGYQPAGERAGYKIYGQTKNPLTGRALPEPLMMVVGPDGKHTHFPRDHTGMTSNEKLAAFLNEKDGRGQAAQSSKPAKTVSAPRGMDGLTRAERKAKAGGSARGPAAPKVTAAPVSTPSGASNAERFRATYERALTEQIKTNPSRYAYGVDRAPEIAKRMTDALATGQGDHTSPTVKATAKTLGVKPTVGGLKSFLSSSKLGMAVAIGSTALGLVSALRSSPATAAPAPAESAKTRTKPYTDSAGREYRNGRLIVRPAA